MSLAATVAARLAAAGLERDPALEQLRAWNAEARRLAELDPARAGHRHWSQADRRRQAPR